MIMPLVTAADAESAPLVEIPFKLRLSKNHSFEGEAVMVTLFTIVGTLTAPVA
jgi:hypothetical protein